jgi:small-conductance mechanosensitive channel
MPWISLAYVAASVIPVGGTPSPFQAWWDTVSGNPATMGARSGLTLAVLLAALLAGRWLAQQAGRVMEQEPATLENGHLAGHWRLMRTRGSLSPLLERVTRLSVWIAAVAALAVIWFYGVGIPAESPREVGILAGDLAARIGGSLVTVAMALALGRILQESVLGGLKEGHVSRNVGVLIARTIYVATLIVGLIVILAIWGTGLVVPVALLGALTVALSLALQDILKNVVAGIYLLLEHPFVISDQITAASYTGDVENIQLRVTVLRTADNEKVLIPNALLFTSAVVNHSGYTKRRVGLTVALPDSASATLDEAERAILDALANVPGTLRDPAPQVTMSKAAAGKLELRADFWLPSNVAGDGAIISQAIGQVRSRLNDAEVAMLDGTAVPA